MHYSGHKLSDAVIQHHKLAQNTADHQCQNNSRKVLYFQDQNDAHCNGCDSKGIVQSLFQRIRQTSSKYNTQNCAKTGNQNIRCNSYGHSYCNVPPFLCIRADKSS